MLYQLPNGKTIEISTEDFLDMDDEDFQNIIASGYGLELTDPFFYSGMQAKQKFIEDISDQIDDKDLTEINIIDKLNDQDMELPDD